MTDASAAGILSLACALIGTACLATWPLLASRRGMLRVQLGIPVGFGLHYAIEGAATAAVLNGLGAVQLAASLMWGTSRHLRWIGYGLVPAILAAGIVTWSGLPSLLSVAGTMLIAVGRLQVDPSVLRLLVLAGMPFWLVHDMMIQSPVMVADLLSIMMGVFAVLRHANGRPLPLPGGRGSDLPCAGGSSC